MKKIFSLMVLLLTVCGIAHAQYMLKVQLKDGTHELFQIDCTDEVYWEKDFIDPNKVRMLIQGRLAGKQNRYGTGYSVDEIENVTVVGCNNHAELWDSEAWKSVYDAESTPENIAAAMEELEF